MSFEESLVRNAAPTMASIKIANLFNFQFNSSEECAMTIGYFNSLMNGKGVYIELLKESKDFYLIYVYRKSYLRAELQREEIKEFLESFGYPKSVDLKRYIGVIKTKLKNNAEFPHEIGVFLGYPLSDVKAFIETKGQDCLVCGEWKAYQDEENAECTFCKYKHCKEVYVRTYQGGRKLCDMLVSA